MKYLTLGSCLKQEEAYMMDFVKYHRYVGVEHFVFFDREFSPLSQLLGKEPDVEIVHFPDVPENVHAVGWGKLIGHNQGKTKWLALIDADQVLVPVQTHDVREVLKNYENFASLQCNWHTFGSSGRVEKGEGSLYERFLMRAKSDSGINAHTQFVCQPDRTLAARTADPHHPQLSKNEVSVNTNCNIVRGPFNSPPLHDTLWIAHYISKSKEEWSIKNAKGRADIFGHKMPFDMFDHHDTFCNAEKEERVLELWKKANF
jgi:Glycosyl transferase family 2